MHLFWMLGITMTNKNMKNEHHFLFTPDEVDHPWYVWWPKFASLVLYRRLNNKKRSMEWVGIASVVPNSSHTHLVEPGLYVE